MSRPMDIDFAVHVPDEASGQRLAQLVLAAGYSPHLEFDDECEEWTCYCTKNMLATYEGVVGAQSELDELSGPVGGYSDGWGTEGNLP